MNKMTATLMSHAMAPVGVFVLNAKPKKQAVVPATYTTTINNFKFKGKNLLILNGNKVVVGKIPLFFVEKHKVTRKSITMTVPCVWAARAGLV